MLAYDGSAPFGSMPPHPSHMRREGTARGDTYLLFVFHTFCFVENSPAAAVNQAAGHPLRRVLVGGAIRLTNGGGHTEAVQSSSSLQSESRA